MLELFLGIPVNDLLLLHCWRVSVGLAVIYFISVAKGGDPACLSCSRHGMGSTELVSDFHQGNNEPISLMPAQAGLEGEA